MRSSPRLARPAHRFSRILPAYYVCKMARQATTTIVKSYMLMLMLVLSAPTCRIPILLQVISLLSAPLGGCRCHSDLVQDDGSCKKTSMVVCFLAAYVCWQDALEPGCCRPRNAMHMQSCMGPGHLLLRERKTMPECTQSRGSRVADAKQSC